MAGSQKTRRPVWVESGSPAVRARFDLEPPFPLHFRPLEESADRRDPLVAREQNPSLCPPTWVYYVVSGRSWRKARAKPMFRKAGLGRKWDFPASCYGLAGEFTLSAKTGRSLLPFVLTKLTPSAQNFGHAHNALCRQNHDA